MCSYIVDKLSNFVPRDWFPAKWARHAPTNAHVRTLLAGHRVRAGLEFNVHDAVHTNDALV